MNSNDNANVADDNRDSRIQDTILVLVDYMRWQAQELVKNMKDVDGVDDAILLEASMMIDAGWERAAGSLPIVKDVPPTGDGPPDSDPVTTQH